MIAALNPCSTPTSLDCIEAITVIAEATRLPATQSSPASGSTTDSYNQAVEDGGSTWSYKDKSGATKSFTLDATLTTPAFVTSGSSGGDTETGNPTEEASPSPSADPLNPATLDTRTYEPKLKISFLFEDGSTPKVEVIVRTSWLQIYDLQLPGKGASIQSSSIPGGQKLTLTGSPVVIYQEQILRSQLTGETKRVVLGSTYFSFEGLHPTTDYDFSQCTSSGFLAWSSNAITASLAAPGSPTSATFKINGSKITDSGSPNLGFFEAKLPLSLLTCRDSNSLMQYGKTFTSTITYTDGSKLTGQEKSTITLENGSLNIKISDFNFAKTELTISTDEKAALANKAVATKPTPTPTPTPSPTPTPTTTPTPTPTPTKAAPSPAQVKKSITITCIKGKTTKKVSGTNPKCPAGYKKK